MQGDDSTDELTLRSPPFSGWPVALDKDEGFLLSFGKKPNCLEFKEKRSFVVKKSILISAISGVKKIDQRSVMLRFLDDNQDKELEAQIVFTSDDEHDPESSSKAFLDTLSSNLEATVNTSHRKEEKKKDSKTQGDHPVVVATGKITEPRKGLKKVQFESMGFVSFVSVDVKSPLVVEVSEGESYVVYAIRTLVNALNTKTNVKEVREWVVYHRYSAFETFDSMMRRKISDHIDTAVVIMPCLPAKPWIPVAQFSVEFMDSRCQKLDRYMKLVCQIPELLKDPYYLDPLLGFLTSGELWQEEHDKAGTGTSSYLEKGVYGVNSALGNMLDSRDPPTPQEDYEYIKDLFAKNGLTSKKVPWKKFVVSVFGTTSSGKSSFVSHLFTVSCSASSMAGQVDTGFSIIEVIPEQEFLKHSHVPVEDMPKLSVRELKEPVIPSAQNMQTDERYGSVFVYLDASATLDRYKEQLGNGNQAELEKYNKIRTVLINARYLNGSQAEIDLAQRIILIDSKGVDASTMGVGKKEADATSAWAEVKAFQYLAKISNLTLFMIPAHDIRNCEPAISIFELSIVCSEEGLSFLKKQMERSSQEKEVSSAHYYSSDPFAGLLSRMLGLEALYGAAKHVSVSLASQVKKYLIPASKQDIERGTARWEKTFFVLSRVDEVLRVEKNAKQSEFQLFYELGLAFGRRLHYLEPPTFSRVAFLGLPEKQPAHENPFTGFLEDFKEYLRRQCSDSTYDRSRDDSIISMCDELEKSLSSGWMTSMYFKFYGPYVRAAKRRAWSRRFNVRSKDTKKK